MPEANMNLANVEKLPISVHQRYVHSYTDCVLIVLKIYLNDESCQNAVFAEFTCWPTCHWKHILTIILYKSKFYIRVIIFFFNFTNSICLRGFFYNTNQTSMKPNQHFIIVFLCQTIKQTGFGAKIQTNKKKIQNVMKFFK